MLYDRRSMSAAAAAAAASSCCCCCIDLGRRSIWQGEEVLWFNGRLLKRLSLRAVTSPAAETLVKALSSHSADSEDGNEQESRAQRSGSSNQPFSRKVSGSGFGASSLVQKNPPSKSSKVKKKKLGSRVEDDTENKDTFSTQKNSGVTRRAPPKQPLIEAQVDPKAQQIETLAVLALTALFSLIIVEGLALAASGFLPEEWDEILLKAIYPSFTPTVAVFFAGAISYGLYKYLGGDK